MLSFKPKRVCTFYANIVLWQFIRICHKELEKEFRSHKNHTVDVNKEYYFVSDNRAISIFYSSFNSDFRL